MNEPFTQHEDLLATVAAAQGAKEDLRARAWIAHDLAVFSAVRALADGAPIVEIMDAFAFPMEPTTQADGLSLFGPRIVPRETGFAEWLGQQIAEAIKRKAEAS